MLSVITEHIFNDVGHIHIEHVRFISTMTLNDIFMKLRQNGCWCELDLRNPTKHSDVCQVIQGMLFHKEHDPNQG